MVMTNLDSILKSRDITLPTKVHLGEAVVFPVVMYGCQSWTIKKAEHWRTEDLELCWRRLLRVTWTTRRSNQPILKEISPECSLKRLMFKLKVQYFSHLMWRTDSLEKTLMLGKVEGSRRWDDRGCDGWMASLTQWTWVWVNSGSWWRIGRAWRVAVHGVSKGQTWLSDWTDWLFFSFLSYNFYWAFYFLEHNCKNISFCLSVNFKIWVILDCLH